MAFNGSGTFTRVHNFATDKTNLIPVTASRVDAEFDGMATGLTTCLTKDGQQTATARIPFASGTSAMAGSVSGVSYAQTNDADTGVYFPATDEVALAAGGVKHITATGSVVTIPSGIVLKSNTTPYDAFPSGTAIIFAQNAAPTGWTKGSTHDDKVLRVVTGTASSGGTVAFSTVFSRTTTDNFTIAQANLPNVSFTNSGIAISDTRTWATTNTTIHNASEGGAAGALNVGASTLASTMAVTSTGGALSVSSQGSAASGGSGTALNAGIDLRVKYLDTIIATKN